MFILNESDYEQIEYECFKESEFTRILNLTRLKEDNVTTYARMLYEKVLCKPVKEEDNTNQSIIDFNIGRVGKDNKLYDNTTDTNEKISDNELNRHVKYKGTLVEAKQFADKVWNYFHKMYPKITFDNDETIVKIGAEDYFKRKFNLPLN